MYLIHGCINNDNVLIFDNETVIDIKTECFIYRDI